jgi:hypothetical protein
MKVLHLNTLATRPNQEGENKIKRSREGRGEKRDQYGRSKQFYIENDFPVPDHLFEDGDEKDLEYDEDNNLILEDHEVDYEAYPTVLSMKEFSFVIDNEKIGSTIFTKGGEMVQVLESSFEIYAQIEWMDRGLLSKWWVNFKFWVEEKFRREDKKETENNLQD